MLVLQDRVLDKKGMKNGEREKGGGRLVTTARPCPLTTQRAVTAASSICSQARSMSTAPGGGGRGFGSAGWPQIRMAIR